MTAPEPPAQPWAMPAWMEQYREAIEAGGGGNTAEDLMWRLRVGGTNLFQANVYVYLMAVEIDAKIRMLTWLHDNQRLVGVSSSLAEPNSQEPCGCPVNRRGWHRRDCPTWELVGPLSEGNWVLRAERGAGS